MSEKGKIGIVGSGLIGKSWSMLFASAGYSVQLYDVVSENVVKALQDIKDQLFNLEAKGLLRGHLKASEQIALISSAPTLQDCLENAIHIQECVFEDLELKKDVFKQIDQLADDKVVLCSSTSCFRPSLFAESLNHRSQVLVGHPVNPPYFIPLVEMIPTKWTDEKLFDKTRSLFIEIGQKPVVLKKEVVGFAVNRIQYAILNECWRLIADQVMSVEDVDTVMSHGLGLRYAFLGPWETAHLNATGMEEYFKKYTAGIYDVSMDFGPIPRMEGPVADLITRELNKKVPVAKLDERRKWRDQRLVALSQLKKKLDG